MNLVPIGSVQDTIQIVDPSGRVALIDTATHVLDTISYEHHEIHAGSHYFINQGDSIPINNIYDLQFVTPDTTKWSHLTFELEPNMETQWFIYEGATIVATGTVITPYNSNRNSANTSANKAYYHVNTTTANALLDTSWTGATLLAYGIVGANRDGGLHSRDNELILKQNTVYLMRGIANAAGTLSFNMEWYEHTNKT